MPIRSICEGFYVAADGLQHHNGFRFMLKNWERPDHLIKASAQALSLSGRIP